MVHAPNYVTRALWQVVECHVKNSYFSWCTTWASLCVCRKQLNSLGAAARDPAPLAAGVRHRPGARAGRVRRLLRAAQRGGRRAQRAGGGAGDGWGLAGEGVQLGLLSGALQKGASNLQSRICTEAALDAS